MSSMLKIEILICTVRCLKKNMVSSEMMGIMTEMTVRIHRYSAVSVVKPSESFSPKQLSEKSPAVVVKLIMGTKMAAMPHAADHSSNSA